MSYRSFKQSTKSVQHSSGGYGGSQVGGGYSCGVGAGAGYGGDFGYVGGAGGYAGGFGADGFGVGGGYGGAFGGAYGGAYGGGAFGGSGGGQVGVFSINEKQTMQNLNDRLASYLDKVHELEGKNAELERKIKDWYEKHGPAPPEAPRDYSKYFKEIEALKAQIIAASKQNAVILLQCDNARLAADDFKQKFENEQAIRYSVEADINGLRRVMDDLTLSRAELEGQLESLTEELAYLKKNHDDEVRSIKVTEAGKVSVEMNAAPSNDLTKRLNDMRAQYEDLARNNRQEAENNFNRISADLKNQMHHVQITMDESRTEVTNLKKTLQSLQIELQSQLAQKNSLEILLAETEARFCMKLSHLQETIACVEQRLEQLRAESECQRTEYQQLLEMKTKLEGEIATYRSLLDKLGSIQVTQGHGQGQVIGQGQVQGQGQGQGQNRGSWN
ncbi:hypothetical protein XENTR_v10003587 [Xenopus tropicalis]|uniref:Keratin-3, type I cytoskeletal 51 kDa n=1 Tax=Xenopus tropicalis TaxID=8364 RepID=A0A8J1IX61_XENTR|nr:keratin-3, type I cytoskeletal 51 kDa [Xenopus tropicalis]KAE8574798.1 hypothetical protein XENTR_v10003587 [Xenopus tropicalis]